MKTTPTIYQLDNGLRVVHQHVPHSGMVHCGFVVNAGSRHESTLTNGVAHLIEHSTLKGTTKRKPYQILSRIENVGGELDAFTTREKTYYLTASQRRYADRSLELLTDVLFNPTFPENEIEKEKKVIKEEIEMYEDIPEECLMDEFHERFFPDHSLGYNILGTDESLNALSKKEVEAFYDDHYRPDNMVAVIIGNVTANKARKLIDKHLEPLQKKNHEGYESTAPNIGKFNEVRNKNFQQNYCMLGAQAYSRFNEKKYALAVLNMVLGGSGMSSRLNMNIREKYGFVYQIDTSLIAYRESGLFTIDFSTDGQNLNRCLSLIDKEIEGLKQHKLGKIQLNRAKNQVKGQATMMRENHSAFLQNLGRDLLDFDELPPLDEYFRQVDKVTSSDVIEVANEALSLEKMNRLTYRPSLEKG